MLTHLAIKDLVIIRELSLDLSSGMTALTGETGAGKSIMVDALDLALGAKADKRVIRDQSDKAQITATFDLDNNLPAQRWMQTYELDDANNECILHRVLLREGRARAYVNNRPVPLQQLRELGDLLIDIHGQHQHQSLLRPSAQRSLLDAYAGNATLLNETSKNFKDWRQTEIELQTMQSDTTSRLGRLDYIRYQLQEAKDLDVSPAHIEKLNALQIRLAHADELGTALSGVIEDLYESGSAVHPVLAQLRNRLHTFIELNPELSNSIALLDDASIQIEEAVSLLREQADHVNVDPATLANAEAELSQIHAIARKHQLSPKQLAAHFDALQTELDTLDNFDESVEKLHQKLTLLKIAYQKTADKLTRTRKKAAATLSKAVTKSMQELGLEGGEFRIDLMQSDANAAGSDQIEFLVAANPGQSLASLSQTASGGELSRISLAIQVATAGCGEVPTLIYDEVDVGIGGGVATKVGRLLRSLGGNRQVLVVTHLAQVAAHAHHHLQVGKQVSDSNTETRVAPLSDNDKVNEIARMLGSENITRQSLAHASEMMAEASLQK